ncbi:MAG TPA: alpha/beta hydrolase-fold protein [Roseiflexaceae bacterium]|nr:alpha/beta hydrolase-fold protein [Roseiflexaceae bacterium]
MSATALFRPTFTDLRAEIERRAAQGAAPGEIDGLIHRFLTACGDSPAPLVEYDGTVTWIYRDPAAESVAVVGDFLGYDTSRTRMARLASSDLFYLTAQIPLDAQIAYAFAVDNPSPEGGRSAAWLAWLERCRTDPLNRRWIVETHPLRTLSLLQMPGAEPAADIDVLSDEGVTVALHVVSSPSLGISRRVWVHLPADYSPRTRRYPALYFNNGESYLLAARAAHLAEALRQEGEVSPALLVFVQSLAHHDEEDLAADDYVRFLADELVPWVDARYATSPDPRDRVVAGASSGGALALYAALERPELFGGVAVQSPAPLLLPDAVAGRLADNAAHGYGLPRCYVDVGRYESHAFVEHAHALCNALLAGGAALSYQEFPGDHSFAGWRTSLPDALRFHLGASAMPDEL